jgi:Zn-dependent alcohol dehydrogenase
MGGNRHMTMTLGSVQSWSFCAGRGAELTLFGKLISAALSGGGYRFGSPADDRPMPRGELKLDELITTGCSPGAINRGYQDLLRGKNVRSVVVHDH